MTITASDLKFLADLGFEEERAYSGQAWFLHESEPVRLVSLDSENGSFVLYRFEALTRRFGPVRLGPLLSQLAGSNLTEEEFRAVVRAFLHG